MVIRHLDYEEKDLFNHVEFDGAFEFRPKGWDMPNWITIPSYRGIYEQQLFPYDSFMLLWLPRTAGA